MPAVPPSLRVLREIGRRYGHPLGLSGKECSEWASGLGLPKGGSTVLYTGCLYQAVPAMRRVAEYLERAGTGTLRLIGALGGRAVATLLKVVKKAPGKELERYHSALRGIALALMRSGVKVGYLYESDLYAGPLYHDLGLRDLLEEQARAVSKAFEENGVETVITVDPHTTLVLREVYPKILPSFNVRVRHYMEVLSEAGVSGAVGGEAVVHDPCHLSRELGLSEAYRRLLTSLGVKVIEPGETMERTLCCGGPLEAIDPELAREYAKMRLGELREAGAGRVVVACPVCLGVLDRWAGRGLEVVDVGHLLLETVGGGRFEHG